MFKIGIIRVVAWRIVEETKSYRGLSPKQRVTVIPDLMRNLGARHISESNWCLAAHQVRGERSWAVDAWQELTP